MRRVIGQKRLLIAGGIVAFLILSAALALPGKSKGSGGEGPPAVIANESEVIAEIRRALRLHSQRIVISFEQERDVLAEMTAVVDAWVEAALQETKRPDEGDYIRYQYGGYEQKCRQHTSDGRYFYTVEIIPKYYLYLFQEEEVTGKLAEIWAELAWDGEMPDYDKVKVIYDYVCRHVKYDRVHRKNPYYFMRSTAYAALVQENATCQGYCVALYRLLRQAGINVRIVTGSVTGKNAEQLHAWNIVELDGKYYHLDATWDAQQECYSYFLKGATGFSDHILNEAFAADEFAGQYKIAEQDYAPAAEQRCH